MRTKHAWCWQVGLATVVVLVAMMCASGTAAQHGQYAGWVPSAPAAAARAEDLHRVRFYLTPRNSDRLEVRTSPPPTNLRPLSIKSILVRFAKSLQSFFYVYYLARIYKNIFIFTLGG
jgi:hypothetical protein